LTSHARSPVVDEPAELTAEWITTALCAALRDLDSFALLEA
jgi:hypothetical protein